jgi:hypothetical protein
MPHRTVLEFGRRFPEYRLHVVPLCTVTLCCSSKLMSASAELSLSRLVLHTTLLVSLTRFGDVFYQSIGLMFHLGHRVTCVMEPVADKASVPLHALILRALQLLFNHCHHSPVQYNHG